MCTIYVTEENYQQAIIYFKQAYEVSKKSNNINLEYCQGIANIYQEILCQYPESKTFLEECIHIATEQYGKKVKKSLILENDYLLWLHIMLIKILHLNK